MFKQAKMRLTVAFLVVFVGYASARPEPETTAETKAEAAADSKAEATGGFLYNNGVIPNGIHSPFIQPGPLFSSPYLPGPVHGDDIYSSPYLPGPVHGDDIYSSPYLPGPVHSGPILPGPYYPSPKDDYHGDVRKVHVPDVFVPPKVITKTHTVTKVIKPDVYIEPQIHHPKYEFGYGVHDAYHGTNFGHKERRNGYRTEGQYHVQLPDGRLQKVTYYADEFGYHPTITYE